MTKLAHLKAHESQHGAAAVAVIGAGYVASGVINMLFSTPAVKPAVVVNRDHQRAIDAYVASGCNAADVLVSDDADELKKALREGRPAVTHHWDVLLSLPVSIAIEATGAIDYGAQAITSLLDAKKHVISFNAEADALLGWTFHARAKDAGVIYTIADGDQPGVILRLKDEVELMGFECTALLNCKRHLNVHQNPESGSGYSSRDSTSAKMTTAFGDGTKMQIEQAVVANIHGMQVAKRGMVGIESRLETAAVDIAAALPEGPHVDFTRAGDFGAGVAVMAKHPDYESHKMAMSFYKMGDGPDYFFFKPYHLVHLELPQTIYSVLIENTGLGVVSEPHATEVISIAKKHLQAGDELDGIGGFAAYGHIDSTADAEGYLPAALLDYATLKQGVDIDDAIPLSSVELDESVAAVQMWQAQKQSWS